MSNDFRKVLSPDDVPSEEFVNNVNKLTEILDAHLAANGGILEFVLGAYGSTTDIYNKAFQIYRDAGWQVSEIGNGVIRISR